MHDAGYVIALIDAGDYAMNTSVKLPIAEEEIVSSHRSAIAQSLGLDPETCTLIMRWSGLGIVGKSTS
jgi:hypothetical protein